jgi:putative transposase
LFHCIPAGFLREADKNRVVDVAKRHGISDQTIYLWRKRFGKLEPVDVKRLRQLEVENGKLKKLERDLEIEVMKENEVRPHSSLANLTPTEFKQQVSQQNPA